RREDETDVLEAAVFVKMVLPTVIERDDVAAHVGALGALLLDLANLRLLRLAEALTRQAFRHGRQARGDVRDLDELIQLEIGTGLFFGMRFGVKAFRYVILFRRGELLDAAVDAMVIGQHQAIRRDDASRAAAG